MPNGVLVHVICTFRDIEQEIDFVMVPYKKGDDAVEFLVHVLKRLHIKPCFVEQLVKVSCQQHLINDQDPLFAIEVARGRFIFDECGDDVLDQVKQSMRKTPARKRPRLGCSCL